MLDTMSHDDAAAILEDVIDTLVEVGNGTTDEQLHEACDKLLRFRDEYFDKMQGKHIEAYNSLIKRYNNTLSELGDEQGGVNNE